MLLLLLLHYKLGGIPLAEDKEKSLTDETLPQEPEEKSDGWDWDAAVPQTDTTNITFDDLQETELKIETEPAEKEDEEKTEEEAQNPDDDGLCIVCGKRRGNSPSDLYCNECRAKFLRTNYGIGHIILAFVMVIVAALGYFVCTSTVTVSGKLFKAEQCISEKRYNDALNLCSDVLEATDKLNSGVNSVIKGINENIRSLDWFTEGSKSAQIILETYAQTMTINYQDRSTFTSAVDKFVEDGQFELSQNSRIKELYDLSKSFDTLEETLVTKLNNYISEKEDGSYDVKYDEAIKYLDSVKTESDVQKSLVDYYRFMMAYYAEKDADVILGFLGDAYKASGEYKYLYSEVYLAMAWENKAYDTVLNVADEAIKFNKNDASAYYYTVRVYIEKGDLDTADKMCEELREAMKRGAIVLATGNSFEMFGKKITDKNGAEFEGLGFFDFTTTESDKRTVTDSLCEFNGAEIIGFVNKASEIFGITKPFFTVKQGAGNNKNETATEGIIDGNFYGTHIIGPLLIRNKAVAEYFANLLK